MNIRRHIEMCQEEKTANSIVWSLRVFDGSNDMKCLEIMVDMAAEHLVKKQKRDRRTQVEYLRRGGRFVAYVKE